VEKPKFGVLLAPEAIVALRQIIHGDATDRSPTAREIAVAIEAGGCTSEDRSAVLLVLGLADENIHPPKRHATGHPAS